MQDQVSSNQEIAQSYLIPKQQKRIGSEHNELNTQKRKYILEMRKAVCDKDIILEDGTLNRKYFNVKKGQYWSSKETEKLESAVIQLGPLAFKEIKKQHFENWSETEIKLRICRLFRVYDLSVYANQKFDSLEAIKEEAAKNKAEGKKCGKLVGNVFYNPPVEVEESFFSRAANSSFKVSKVKQQ